MKRRIKNLVKRVRLKFLRTFRSFDSAGLEVALRDVGLTNGDVVLVHSSFEAFDGFLGKTGDVVKALENVVGPEGTLLMPTMPFAG